MEINVKAEIIRKINVALRNGEINSRAALDIMETLYFLEDREFLIINKRVCFKENGTFHDAWVNA